MGVAVRIYDAKGNKSGFQVARKPYQKGITFSAQIGQWKTGGPTAFGAAGGDCLYDAPAQVLYCFAGPVAQGSGTVLLELAGFPAVPKDGAVGGGTLHPTPKPGALAGGRIAWVLEVFDDADGSPPPPAPPRWPGRGLPPP